MDNTDKKVNLSDFNLDELSEWLSANDLDGGRKRSFRAEQIFNWLGLGARSFDEMTNLPLRLRVELAARASTGTPEITAAARSQRDGTVKYAMRTSDGNVIESVLMRYMHGDAVCISTQAGCRMGCVFCASKPKNFARSLTPGEIFGQAAAIARHEKSEMNNTIRSETDDLFRSETDSTIRSETDNTIRSETESTIRSETDDLFRSEMDNTIRSETNSTFRIGNVVIMGVGEPFDNYDNTLKAVKLLHAHAALNIGYRKITISTCGIVPGILRLADEGLPAGLSVSLHSADDAVRSRLMPVNRRYSIDKLIEGCKIYTCKTKRRVTFEYALIKGFNDAPDDARRLMRKIRGMLCHINLIPLNNTGNPEYAPPPPDRIKRFGEILAGGGMQVTARRELGTDIMAACGQLRNSIIDSCD